MPNQISALDEINKAIDKLNGKLELSDKNIIRISQNARKVSKEFQSIKTPSGVNQKLGKTKELTEQLSIALAEQKKLEKNLITTIQKKTLAVESTNVALVRERHELQQVNKTVKQAAVLSSTLSTEYQKQATKLNQLIQKRQQLALKQELGNKLNKKELASLKRLTGAIQRKDAMLKRVDAQVGRNFRSVGNYGVALKGAAGAARQFASALGLVGGAFLIVQVMRDAITTVRTYEKSNATLSAILQVTKDDMVGLTAESKRLGETTVKSALEVTELQIAYARLGFSQQEIIDLTAATISGSIAMNAELSATATLTGAIVNTFDDLATTDAPKILDILSLATAKSALNFSKLETGIPIVAGAANAAGIPFTKLIALMGKLSDSGIDVSTSSTSLRNIFIAAAAQGANYEEILEMIKNSTDKLTASNNEFGKRAAVSATVLASNIDQTKELDKALQSAAGTADRMAKKELETLDGAILLLGSAWKGVILDMDDANSAGTKLRKGIEFITANLKTIVSTIGTAIKSLLIYKAVMLGGALASSIASAGVVAYRIAVIAMNGGIGKAIIALKALKVAMATSPLGIFALLLTGAVALWSAFSDGAKQATKDLSDFNKEAQNTDIAISKFSRELKQYTKGQERAGQAVAAHMRFQGDIKKALGETNASSRVQQMLMNLVNDSHGENAKQLGKRIDLITTQLLPAEKKALISQTLQLNALDDIIKKNEEYAASITETAVTQKGTIDSYNKIISDLKKERDSLATNTAAYQSYSAAILAAEAAKSAIIGKRTTNVPKVKTSGKAAIPGGLKAPSADDVSTADPIGVVIPPKSDELLEAEAAVEDEKLALALASFDALVDLGNVLFDGKIQQIDAELAAHENKYARLQVLAEGDAALQRKLAEQEAKEKEKLEEKKRKLQKKQAIFNKAASIVGIALNTAIGISSAAAAVVTLPLVPFIAALGAIQMATVLATPIPQFAEGKGKYDNYEGAAIWGEKRREAKISTDGSIELSPKKIANHMTHVKKDDIIHPDANKLMASLSQNELYDGIHQYSINANMNSHDTNLMNFLAMQGIESSINKQTSRLEESIRKNKPNITLNNNVDFGENMDYLLSYQNTL
jgi:hypothetical protein